ncbi:hypothetical protein CBOM_07754 [Ceraceosorus bombacis]|uniref:Uncharacterized protein n=1 Tax=Ceraceosorus bombacis TaxID=401625 RepID=A0A0P1BN50_9BASI|nr:hypothetical protein CBOM_07754 [Ceraceosorus bombacis]
MIPPAGPPLSADRRSPLHHPSNVLAIRILRSAYNLRRRLLNELYHQTLLLSSATASFGPCPMILGFVEALST